MAKSEIITPLLLPIEKNSEAQKITILTNIVKMLTERDLIHKNNQDQYIKKVTSIQSDDQTYKIPIDNPAYGKDINFLIVKIINQRITSISKSSGVSDFLNNYKTQPKIIVVPAINPKTQSQVQSDTVTYPNTEIFLERELLINLVDHVSQPKFKVLSEEEAKSVLDSYHAKRRDIPKILVGDPVSRYYNVRHGQMFRIIRPSETSGEAVTYRIVIKGQIKETVS